MRFSISTPNFDPASDPQTLAEMAREAEHAGWDGFFVWDHLLLDPAGWPITDPWIALAAIAMATQRIRIGTMVTPLPRRHPWTLARQTVAVDRLSGGRLILGVGLGDPARVEFGAFGQETDVHVRAEQLDEGLAILAGLWSGEPFSFSGKHYRLSEMTFLPTPVQRPRIPIWVGGYWPRKAPMRRAARWDGVNPLKTDMASFTPNDLREIVAYIGEHRTSDAPFDVVAGGETPGGDDPAEWAAAGATWWIEPIHPQRFAAGVGGEPGSDDRRRAVLTAMTERIRQGPPRV